MLETPESRRPYGMVIGALTALAGLGVAYTHGGRMAPAVGAAVGALAALVLFFPLELAHSRRFPSANEKIGTLDGALIMTTYRAALIGVIVLVMSLLRVFLISLVNRYL
jgi:hypothetical protein